VTLVELTGRRERRRLIGPEGFVYALAFHPREALLATGSMDDLIRFWDLHSARTLRRYPDGFQPPLSDQVLAMSPDGGLLAIGTGHLQGRESREYPIALRATDSWSLRRTLPGHATPVEGLVFDPAGRRLASAAHGGSVIVWDVATGQPLVRLEAGNCLVGMDFLAGGTRLVLCANGGRMLLVDPASGAAIREALIPGEPTGVAISPAGDLLVAGGRNGTLRVVALPELTRLRTLEGAAKGEFFGEFSRDGRWLGSVTGDRRIVLRDARTLERLVAFPAQSGQIVTWAFSPDSRYLAVSAQEEQATVWDLGLIRGALAPLGLDWGSSAPAGPTSDGPDPS
jgi:WD40 repeat protein